MQTVMRKLIVIASLMLLLYGGLAAEELGVLKGYDGDVNNVVEIPNVNVYAIMQSGLLIGADNSGINNLSTKGYSVEYIGTQDFESSYFLFQAESEDLRTFESTLDILYTHESEVIARINEGQELRSNGILRNLTHISFTPKPVVDRSPVMPIGDLLTDPAIEAIVNQVSEVQYTSHLQRLQDFVTRYSYTDSCRAAEQWAINRFQSLGLQTELWSYNYSSYTWYNAIGRQIGTVYPDSFYIIVAHIDATSEDPDNNAPGAEDNGSGSACVLEAARILSQYDLDCSVEYLLVSGEEQGLYGSEAYALDCYNSGKNIGGVLNFDMIAYAGTYGWDTNIYSDQNFPAEVALADFLALQTDDYSDAFSIRVNTDGPEYGSDHYYFSYYGFPAPFSIDAQMWSAPDWHPWYHTTSDVIGNLDLDYATEVVKGAVATLATLVGLSSPPLLEFDYPNGIPNYIDPFGFTSIRVEVNPGSATPTPGTGMLHYSTGGGYTHVAMQVVSPNVYFAEFPPITCGDNVTFYFSSDSDSGVVNDPWDAPTSTYSALSAAGFDTSFADNFQTNLGWTAENLGATSGDWQRGIPVNDPGWDYDPISDGDGSGQCYLTQNQTGNTDIDGGAVRLTSPSFDMSLGGSIDYEYYLYLTDTAGGVDRLLIEMNDNGGAGTWYEVTRHDTNGGTSWRHQVITENDITSAGLNLTSNMRIRYTANDADPASIVEAGVDGFAVTTLDCGGLPTEVTIDMRPDDDPVFTTQGGSFDFTGILNNNTAQQQYTDVWIMLVLPNSNWYGPIRQWNNIPLAPNDSLVDTNASQYIPGYAMVGEYEYWAFCGDYPSSTMDSAMFDFLIFPGLAKGATDWNIDGWFDDSGSNLPLVTELHGNFPNPFNATTTFNYSLSKVADVRLEVFNLMGQKVETLINGRQTAGLKTIQWDASSYSSGVYFYKLSAGEHTFTKRMTLLK